MASSIPRSVTSSEVGRDWTRSWRLAWRTLRNPLSLAGLLIIGLLILMAFIAPAVAPYDPLKTNTAFRLQPPSAEHIFGTDQLGRDIFSRVLYGARISLRIAILTAVIALVIGGPLGIVSGYFRGRV